MILRTPSVLNCILKSTNNRRSLHKLEIVKIHTILLSTKIRFENSLLCLWDSKDIASQVEYNLYVQLGGILKKNTNISFDETNVNQNNW